MSKTDNQQPNIIEQAVEQKPARALRLILLTGLAAAICALLLFAWLANEILEGETVRFDSTIRDAVHEWASPALTSLMRAMTALGSPLVLVILGVCTIAIFLWQQRRRAALLLGITFLGAPLLNFTLKFSFHRTRPVPFFDTPLPDSFSFPSGHALWSCCFYGVVAAILAARTQSLIIRAVIWAMAAALILLIGLSRIYLGVHYPSDVLAGYAAAIVWVAAVGFGDHLFQRRAQRAVSRQDNKS